MSERYSTAKDGYILKDRLQSGMPATDDKSDREAAAAVPTAVTLRDCEISKFVCCQYDQRCHSCLEKK